MCEQLELDLGIAHLGKPRSPNPMVYLHGPGPEGSTCGACKHLEGHAYARMYWKCTMRGDLTHGAATDQRRRWPGCALFEGV